MEADGVEVKETELPDKKKKREYSKAALAAMIVLWFIGAVIGSFTVLWQLFTGAYAVQLDSLLNYIGMPMSGGIVTYMVKSALENREKIRKSKAVDDGVGGSGRGE